MSKVSFKPQVKNSMLILYETQIFDKYNSVVLTYLRKSTKYEKSKHDYLTNQ